MPSAPLFPRLDPWTDPRLEVRPSTIHGLGVFARSDIAAGEIVMRWGGIVIPLDSYDPALHRARSTTQWSRDAWLTMLHTDPETVADRMNHRCDANTWMLDAVQVQTRWAVRADEEVTTDVAMWADDGFIYTEACACGSPLCRGRVTGRDWLRPELQARYADHFVPFLAARMPSR